jgi:hypothetical protein
MKDLSKPPKVLTAVRLLWAALAIDLFSSIATLALFSPSPASVLLLPYLFIQFAITGLLIFCIAIGQNWARFIFTLFVAINTALVFFNTILDIDDMPVLVTIGVITSCVQIYALYLLFNRVSSSWFHAPKAVA